MNAGEVRIEIPGKPVPASRPRVTNGRAYYRPAYQTWRSGALLVARSLYKGEPLDGPCSLSVWFYGADKTADADNVLKAASDLVQSAGIVANDRQFDEMYVRRGKEGEPRMIIVVRYGRGQEDS